MSGPLRPLSSFLASERNSVDPALFPRETFDLYSIPAYDTGQSDLVQGSSIGSTKQTVRPGDVLLSKIVPHLRRAWIVGPDRGYRAIGSGEWIVFRSPQIESAYLRQVLLGNTFHQEFMRTVAGVGGSLLRARPSQVAQIQIPVPPLDEQRRIAAILDKADVLRAKRRAAIVKLDSLTQSIFLDMFGNPVTNPKSWPSKSLTEVCDTFSGGTPSKADDSFWNGNIPWFSAKDMKKGDLFDAEDHVTESAFDQTSLRLLAENTVAIVVRGMILAHTFPVCVLKNPSAINQDLKALIPRLPLPADYLAANLRCQSPHVLSAVSEAAHGTKRLDAEGLRKIAILLPPIEMRHEFATRSAKVSAMRRAYTSSLGRLDALFASLQHRAFNGELRTTAAQDGY